MILLNGCFCLFYKLSKPFDKFVLQNVFDELSKYFKTDVFLTN